MIKYPYETTPCADYVLGAIKKEIELAFINGELPLAKRSDGSTCPNILQIPPSIKTIQPFAHPLQFTSRYDNEYLVIDTRGMTRQNLEGEITVKSTIDYNLLLMRALLTEAWVKHDPLDLLACGSLPLTVFSRWLAENISRRLPINPGDQMKITVVAGWYYLNLFRSEDEINEQLKLKMATQIARSTYIGADKVIEIADQLSRMRTIADFVEQLKQVIDSSALEKFSYGLLYTFVGGSWFGSNARETLAVALEHPPTFLSLVYAALQDRSWRKTGLGELVLRNDKGDAGKSFSYNLLSLLKA